ncbi:hypothetical protein [Streptomyces spiralis]|uniref:hypothetical protein n=1 Tax=Streptomyces spiralis TaxID=66376 RepID=UPI0036B91E54
MLIVRVALGLTFFADDVPGALVGLVAVALLVTLAGVAPVASALRPRAVTGRP